MRGPRREMLRDGKLRGMLGFVDHPAEDAPREHELVESAAEERGDVSLERRAVKRRGLRGLDLQHRAALHELALDAEEGSELVVALDELAPFVLDREELRDEAVHLRRD